VGEGQDRKPSSQLGKAGLRSGVHTFRLLGRCRHSYRIERRSTLKFWMVRELLREHWVEVSGKTMLDLHLEVETVWELSELSWVGVEARSNAGGRISGGSRFCVHALDYCQIRVHGLNKVNLLPEHLYIMPSEKGRSKSATSSAWHVHDMIFGGRIIKLSDQTFNDIEFKRFSKILILQIEQGIDPVKIEGGGCGG
jgi:hypothetical protein